jgi:iron complex outermembrane receptor protein
VARISATEWAINIRGLNGQFAQNLLVLIDGRSVYTPVFSGVFWDVQDTVLEDIDRIEVIRGPGASVWGANAVNGVINIITKSAKDTQGGEVVALAGSEEQQGSLRYGGQVGKGALYRVYGKFFNRADLDDVELNLEIEPDIPTDAQSSDNWRSGRGGFKVDILPGSGFSEDSPDAVTVQGEAYLNRYDKEFERRSTILPSASFTQDNGDNTSAAQGWHLLTRWKHDFSKNSETVLQAYYDHTQKDYDPGSGDVNTADLDFQHRLNFSSRHEVVWGLNYRHIADEFDQSPNVQMNPSHQNQNLWGAFVQDEIQILPDKLDLIVGSKFEYNEFTRLEIQPTLRGIYSPLEQLSIWSAISRAVRVPSRLEFDGQTKNVIVLPGEGEDEVVEVITEGNSDLASEDLTAYEIGFRYMPFPFLQFDTALFYNDYSNLIVRELIDVDEETNQYFLGYANDASGEAYGLELTADWKVNERWLLRASYSYLHTHIDQNKIEDQELDAIISEDSNPQNLFSVQSNLDVTPTVDFDLWFRFVGRLPEREISSYSVLDARIAWRPIQHLELSLVGQNLLEEGHSEFSTLEVQRSVYGKIDWQF